MSGGDTQPKKRKDKKRKKDDEDTVKETVVHPPKPQTSGAAQAAKEPGDVQMHIHSDHGTGGHWCAKVVFFILLAGLGVLIGLIIMENQGVSNEDTPLSESRYSEFFNGWVDENRQDDHHHEEILAAINSLDDHDDDDGEAHHGAVDDHDDDHDGDDDDGHDDGAPYEEEEDHDDDDGTDVQDDDEDEGPASKLDDDEVEEIFAQQEAAAQLKAGFADQDDDDDNDDDPDNDGDDDDEDDAGANGKTRVDDGDDDDDDKNEDTKTGQSDDGEDDDNDKDDDKNDNDQDGDDDDGDDDEDENDNVVTKTNTENDNENDDDENDDNDDDQDNDDNDDDEKDDDNDNDDDENVNAAADDDDNDEDDDNDGKIEDIEDDDDEPRTSNTNAAADDGPDDDDNEDDDDDDNIVDQDQDDSTFDEEKRFNALNETPNRKIRSTDSTANGEPVEDSFPKSSETTKENIVKEPEQNQIPAASTAPPTEEPVTGDVLKEQMDELVRKYNKLAESLDVPKVEETVEAPKTLEGKDENDDKDLDGDEDEIEEVTRGSQSANEDDGNDDDDGDDDDDDDNNANDDDRDEEDFNDFVDNDGGEAEYLEKVRIEQQRRAEEQRKAAVAPEEETSQKPSTQSDDPKTRTDTVPTNDASSPIRKLDHKETTNTQTATSKSVLNDFVYAGPSPDQISSENREMDEGNDLEYEENEDAERYSGDDYEYEIEDMEQECDSADGAEDDEERVIKQEQEIGAFVPITFEEFNSMFRPTAEMADVLAKQQPEALPTQANTNERPSGKKSTKESLLARKKPPKGALNKLIYGLHKDPILIPGDEAETHTERIHDREVPGQTGENVSAKGEAKSVLTALLSEIPSPPIERDHEFVTLVPKGSPVVKPSIEPSVSPYAAQGSTAAIPPVKEKHVEFRLPGQEVEPYDEVELEFGPEHAHPAVDNGSKENLFVPDASEEELEPDEYAEEYEEYEGEEEILYEEEELDGDVESILLNQYGSDEEEEPLTDDNIPPGGEYDEASDVDDSDLMRRLEEKYGKLPASASTGAAKNSEATGPDAEDDEAAGWTKIPSRAEEADRSYQEELRRAEQQLDEKKPQEALNAFDRVIERKPNSIAALIGRARSLDALAEVRRSNAILTEAIAAYRKVIEQELAVDDETFRTVAERCIDRMRFQGQHAKAIEVHQVLIRRFDNEPHYRNQLAVSYLYLNRLAEAKAVLHETLHRWIDNGFALVHYGFVLKTLDQNMELAAQYLEEGIETGQDGTQDGRFYFQLGDALQRLGRTSKALDVYRKGVSKGLFMSLYQRSLYNVDGLRSRPFWSEAQTTYTTELDLIRAQWTQIRNEGMSLLSASGVFVNESENLRDRGDWKQLELFSRGVRQERNCARAPLTCRLVEQHFPAARSCKRGQVKFSVMHPGTHVWSHCGPTNCRIRAHLGLSVPDGTFIRVAEETRSWENGKWLIFDDSFEHEVWHNGTTTRLVLIVDFWHPDLTESQRRTLTPI